MDETYQSFFQDAAHSMAAVGMLAPFVEALFVAIFRCLQSKMGRTGQAISNDQRMQAAESEFWDPRFFFGERGRKRDLVVGITQLAVSTELARFFPSDRRKTLEALFLYRNKMFHHGFVWPERERVKFQKKIQDGCWPSDWFWETTHNKNPWIFYMSDEFIEHCLRTIDRILDGFGAHLRDAD